MLELLRAEIIKLRKDKAMRLAVLGFLGATAMVLMMFAFGHNDLVRRDSWNAKFFIGQSVTMLALLIGPMMLAVAGTQLITVEYREKTLKGLLPLPVSLSGLFAAKAVIGGIYLVIVMAITAAVTALVPTCLGIPPTGALLLELLRMFGALWVAFLPLLLAAMVVGLISKNFVAPLAFSAVVLVGGVLALQGDKGQYFWTAIPMMLVGGGEKMAHLGARLLTSTAYAVGFLFAGLLWAKLTRRPE